jgi:outer membrane receptor for ferric coprogen and ferric-rhodotorulic acid
LAQGLVDSPAVYTLRIPRQSLESALQEFARQTGVQIVFISQITRGLEARGLEGQYTVRAGLDALLASSGLTFSAINTTTLEVRREDRPAAQTASVAHAPDRNTDNGAVEEVLVRGTAEQLVATRTRTPLIEIPQTISIISHEQIEQQSDLSLSDALSRAPGVTAVRNDSLDQTLYVRGFKVTSFHIDGGAALQSWNIATVRFPGTPDLAEFDHIEVLHGADGLFGSNGSPGATVSLVRKRPLATPAVSVDFTAGSWNNYRMDVDATGPLGLDGALRGRIGAVYVNRDYFYDTAHLERRKVFGMLDYDITPTTLLTVGGSYQADHALPFTYGLPLNIDGSDPHLPRHTSLTFDWSFYRTHTWESYLQLRQGFGEDWTLRFNTMAGRGWIDYAVGSFQSAINPSTGGLFAAPIAQISLGSPGQRQLATDLTLTGRFELFGRDQEIALGGDYTTFTSHYAYINYNRFQGVVQNVSDYDPSMYADPRLTQAPGVSIARDTSYRQSGVYVSWKSHLAAGWSIVGGARLSSDREDNLAYSPLFGAQAGSVPVTIGNTNVVTPYAAVMYDLSRHYSLYASYADIYQTSPLARAKDGSILTEAHGVDVEMGVKTAWRDGTLNGTLVVYHISQYGTPVNDPSSLPQGCCYVPGINKSQGVDLELEGTPEPGWLLGSGYSYNTNRAADAAFFATEGSELSSHTPQHLLKIWSSYRLPGFLSRWSAGGSLQAQSANSISGSLCKLDVYGNCVGSLGDYRTVAAAYAVLDLRLGYQFDTHWNLALTVGNVFDKTYYESIGGPAGNNWYGEPRSFLVQVGARF